jgi:Mrp family chromosome partitioning ATPase
VNGVVLVVGAEVSGRAHIQRAVDQVVGVGGKVIGVVLNKVDLKRNSYYYGHYYGEYYRGDYSEGVGETARPQALTAAPVPQSHADRRGRRVESKWVALSGG